MLETWVQCLVWEDLLEKGKATHSSILVWRIPWTEKPGGLQFMGLQRVGHNWVTELTNYDKVTWEVERSLKHSAEPTQKRTPNFQLTASSRYKKYPLRSQKILHISEKCEISYGQFLGSFPQLFSHGCSLLIRLRSSHFIQECQSYWRFGAHPNFILIYHFSVIDDKSIFLILFPS